MLKETENEETKLFCHIFIIGGILIGEGGPGLLAPLATPTIITSMVFVILIKILYAFLLLCANCACQSDTNSSILYDHAKYAIYCW